MSNKRRAALPVWFDWLLPRRGWVFSLALLWLLAGFLTFVNLKRDLFPDMYLPSVQLLIQSPGRAATELEMTVAQPVEQALAGLPGVKRVVSTVQTGIVAVVIAFDGDADPWRSRQLVAEKMSGVVNNFPAGTISPLMTSASGRLQEIQELILSGPGVDPMRLRDHAIKVLVPRLQAVPGVSRTELLGGNSRQTHITLNVDKMRLLGVGLDRVLQALEGSGQDASAGVLEIRDKTSFVVVGSMTATAAEIGRLPVSSPRGMVTLSDFAEIKDGPGFRMGLSSFSGHEVVSIRVVKQPTAEALATTQAVRDALPELRKSLPSGMKLEMFYDQGEFIQHALGGVTQALLLGGFFVALVLIVLLGNLRGSLIVIALLPLATFGAAIPLYFLGQGLNAMTLGGLAISVGLLVDAGVIMVENLAHRLHEHLDHVEPRRVALSRAAAEVALPILVAVLVILAVFIPLLSIGGVAGRLFAPLAIAVASAMTLSLILSFTLIPALVDRFMPPGEKLDEPALVIAIKKIYRPALDWAMHHGVLVQFLALALTLPSMWLALRLGSNFLPSLNEGAYILNSNFPAETSVAAVDEGNYMLETRLAHQAGVKTVLRKTGRGEVTEDPMPHYSSDVLVTIEKGVSQKKIERELAELAEGLPYPVELTTPMGMKIAEGIGGTPADLQVKLFNPDLEAIRPLLPELRRQMAGLKGVASVFPDEGGVLPKWQVIPDDEALRRMNVPRAMIFLTLKAALQGIESEPRYDGPQVIPRMVRFANDGRMTAADLARLPIVLDEGRVVELGQVARIEERTTPSMIRREAGQRRLGLNIRTTGDLGGTAKRVEALLAKTPLPKGTTTLLGGKIEEARETQRRLSIAIFLALALVVGLLYFALGSWREVGVVLVTLPNAFAGGLFALYLAGENWNVSSIVGMIGLFGVAVQNSLVLITQTKGLIHSGMPFKQALREASIGRVRPKLMTAGAAILGLSPMLFGIGGSELERPLALVMVGGLVTSTLFTLLVLPSFYAWACAPRLDNSGAAAAPPQQPVSDP